MSQILSVDIFRNEESEIPIACVSYRWSGYSIRTLKELDSIREWILKNNLKGMSDEEARLSLIRYAENNGGGVDDRDNLYVKEQFDGEEFSDTVSSDSGLVALNFGTMEDTRASAEGYAYITIDDDMVKTDVYDIYEDYESYKFYMEENNVEDIPNENDLLYLQDTDITESFSGEDLWGIINAWEGLLMDDKYEYMDGQERIVVLVA